jgi:uncharacterized membrane protein YoaK (UPF0700 family)
MLLLALTFASGSIDAMSFFSLGHVFTANMTGNIVLFGIALGSGGLQAAVRNCIAFGAFIVGLIAGVRLMRQTESNALWPRAATRSLWIEIGVLIVLTAGWERSFPRPHGAIELSLIAISAVAMGLQTATVALLRVKGIATTYVTGTLTSIFVDLGAQSGFRSVAARIGVLLALLAGAAISSALVLWAPAAVPLPAIAAIGAAAIATSVSRGLR